jgi:hypothetical protein
MIFHWRHVWTVLAMAAIYAAMVPGSRAQQIPGGRATDFTSSAYYGPPNVRQVKMRLSGAEALPLPDGRLEVKQLKIETFSVSGKPEAVVSAPQCIYAPLEGMAGSSGRLELRSADGQVRVEGDGFLWQQADNSLTISNNVHTVIQAGSWAMTLP